MFDIDKKKWSSHFKNFDEEDFEHLCMRLSAYYRKAQKRKQKLTKNLVMRSFFILQDMQDEKYRKMKKKIDYTGIRHQQILKFGDEILALREEGKGAQFISSKMKSLHNAKIVKNSIQNFLDKQVFFKFGNEILKLDEDFVEDEEIVNYLKDKYKIVVSETAITKYIKNEEEKYDKFKGQYN